MARSRNIKPGFFIDELLAECAFESRLLFSGLWCLADREGRLRDRPKKIKGEIFPHDNVNVEILLAELASKLDEDGSPAFLIRYVVDGIRYIQVVHFLSHQNPHKNERDSIIPTPESIAKPRVCTEHPNTTRALPEDSPSDPADSLSSDSLSSDSFAFSLEVQEKACELLKFTPLQAIKKTAWEVSSLRTDDRRHVFSRHYDMDIRFYIKEISVKALVLDLLSLRGKNVEYPLDYCMKSEPGHRWARWEQIASMIHEKEIKAQIVEDIGMDKLLERFKE